MRVVPERARLTWCFELVTERMARGNGALSHTGGSISPGTAGLEEAVPMLRASVLLKSYFHATEV